MRTIICLQKRFFLHTKKIYPDIGLATVYRNLELLEKLGIIHRFDYGDGQSRYEISLGGRGRALSSSSDLPGVRRYWRIQKRSVGNDRKADRGGYGFCGDRSLLAVFLVSAPPVKRNGNLDKKQVRVYYIGNIKGVDGGE